MQLVMGRGGHWSASEAVGSQNADFKGLILPCVGEHAAPVGKDSCLARPSREFLRPEERSSYLG